MCPARGAFFSPSSFTESNKLFSAIHLLRTGRHHSQVEENLSHQKDNICI